MTECLTADFAALTPDFVPDTPASLGLLARRILAREDLAEVLLAEPPRLSWRAFGLSQAALT